MELGVFIPIGNNGWLISTTSPQYMPTFDLNRDVVRKGRALRLRFRAVDDQTARVRRPVAVLGLQSRIVHADGRPGRGDEPHPAVRHLRRADHAAADRRPHGGDDRLDFARPVRRQHHLRLAAARIHADGDLAGRRALPAPLRVLRRIRHHHARAVGDRPLRLQGRLLPDGRLPLSAAAHARRSRSSAPRRATPAPALRRNTPTTISAPAAASTSRRAVAPSVARLVAATARRPAATAAR